MCLGYCLVFGPIPGMSGVAPPAPFQLVRIGVAGIVAAHAEGVGQPVLHLEAVIETPVIGQIFEPASGVKVRKV